MDNEVTDRLIEATVTHPVITRELITYDNNSKIHRLILTEDQKLYITNHCKTTTNSEMASVLGIPEKGVKVFIHHKKLRPTTSRPYGQKEVQFIKKNFRKRSYKEMGEILGRTSDSVRKKTQDLRLRRSQKDLKFLQKKYCCKTYYPKNHQPGNTLFDGAVTVRKDNRGVPHKYIRLTKNKWIELQIYNWQMQYGPVPAGMVLKCINGDTLDCDPQNYKLISKQELLEGNSGRRDLTDKYIADILSRDDEEARQAIVSMPDLLEAKRVELKLRRTINEHDGDNNRKN
jgi:hypothetical protein